MQALQVDEFYMCTVVLLAILKICWNWWIISEEREWNLYPQAIDTTTPSGKFIFTIFGAVVALEIEYILQRQREGIMLVND